MRHAADRRPCRSTAGICAPAVYAPEANLAPGQEAEKQAERGVLGRQAALRLHAAPELLVQPLDHVRRVQRLPLALGGLEDREHLLAAFVQAPDHAEAARRPLALEVAELMHGTALDPRFGPDESYGPSTPRTIPRRSTPRR